MAKKIVKRAAVAATPTQKSRKPAASASGGVNFKARLKALSKNWAAAVVEGAEAAKQGFATVPDGRYIARLTGYVLGESADGWPHLRSEWTVVKGDEAGSMTTRRDGLDRDESLPFLARYLMSLGVENLGELDITELDTIMDGLVAERPAARIRLITKTSDKGEFQNLYVDKLIDLDPSEDETAPAADPDAAPSDAEPEPEPDAEVEPPMFEVGDEVQDEDGKTVTIVKIKGDDVTVKDEDGDKVLVDISTLSALVHDAGDGEAYVPTLGDKVRFEYEEKPYTGKAIKVDVKKETVQVKPATKIKGLDADDILEFSFDEVEELVTVK